MELYARAAELVNRKARYNLACIYDDGGDLRKAKFHYELAAMAGHDVARFKLGMMEYKLGNMERAVRRLRHRLGIIKPCNPCKLQSN